MPELWYLSRGAERYGPYAWEDVVRYAGDGHIAATDQLWNESTGVWQPASSFPELFPATPPPPTVSPAAPPPVVTPAPIRVQAPVRRLPKWIIPGVLVVLVSAAVVTFVLTRVGEGTSPAESVQTAETMFVDIPGRTIPLDVGGSLFVPDGALPDSATVQATYTEAPAMPEGVTALGPTLEISVEPLPVLPVQVRLPLPAGSLPPDGSLAILRSLDLGYTELLMAEVQDDELVAYTSAFSRFTIVGVAGISPVTLNGQTALIPGQRETYLATRDLKTSPPGSRMQAFWSAEGHATLISENVDGATVEAADTEGTALISYLCVDTSQGMRWYGALPVRVTATLERPAEAFIVSAVTDSPTVNPGDAVEVTASVHGDFEPPIHWEWEATPDIRPAAQDTGPGVATLTLPPLRFEQGTDPHRSLVVRATDARGRQRFDVLSLFVVPDALQVSLSGPSLITWDGTLTYGEYTATATEGLDRYQFSWLRLPGDVANRSDRPGASASWAVNFPEPGDYRLRVTVEDDRNRKATTAYAVTVVPLESLSTRFLDLPGTVLLGEEILTHIQVRGGTLISGGTRRGYRVQVKWCADCNALDQSDIGTAGTPDQGAAIETAYAWTRPGTHTVVLTAWDASGARAVETRQVVVTEEVAEDPTESARENRAPLAEDLTTSAERGSDVALTLHGSDEDGDSLTYTIVQGPGQGTLTGEPPFLTYKPNIDLTGGKDTFTFTVSDGQATSAPATVTIVVGTRWVLQGAPVLNREEARREFRGGVGDPEFFGEERFAGMYTIYTVSAGSITWEDRWVDRGYEAWNISIGCAFDAPPAVLYAGDVLPLEVSFTHSGSVTEGNPGLRFQFYAGTPLGDNPLAWTDWNERRIVDPASPAPFFPWEANFNGVSDASWTLSVPEGRAGEALAIQAGVWGCAPCNVTWVYIAE